MTNPHFISPDSAFLGVCDVGDIAEDTPDTLAALLNEGIRFPQISL